MSTFPDPPQLAPPSKAASPTPITNSASSTVPTDFGIPSQNGSATPGNSTASNPGESNSIPVTAGTLTSMEALDDKNLLQPGDRISFRVVEDKDQAVPRVVTDTGEVDFPYIGRVKVQGQTCHQVAIQVKKLLEVDYYKQATVIVGLDVIADSGKEKQKPHDFAWVVGQVKQVGPQELTKEEPMTVSQVILRAGGFGDFADQRKVKLIHHTSLTLPPASTDSVPADAANSDSAPDLAGDQDAEIIDIKSVFEGQSKVDPIVKPNDYIIVPKRAFNY